MPKGSKELTAARRDEITNACEKLYKTMSFKDISLKEIAKETSFTRPSIYNYFQSREEIFLALFEREYCRWNDSLLSILNEKKPLDKAEFSHRLAESVASRPTLLKLLSMNCYDMEAESRPECLVEFKKVYGASYKTLESCFMKFFPGLGEERAGDLTLHFCAFMFGIYPYTNLTPKQQAAMDAAGCYYKHISVYELTLREVEILLG